MVNPETLDIRTLPWLPLEEKAAFPKKSAIYFAIDSQETVQYIGRSVNVRHRWGSHHKYDALSEIGNVKIAYLFVDAVELLPKIEAALIEWFNPPLNNSFSNVDENTSTQRERQGCGVSKRISVVLPDDIGEIVKAMAGKERRSLSQMSAILIEESLKSRELLPEKPEEDNKGVA